MNREYADEISTAIGELKKDGRYRELNNYIQHGTVSVFKRNAMQDYNISDKEADIILKHMFPLTIIPPNNREAWIVCMADKICATYETAGNFRLHAKPVG